MQDPFELLSLDPAATREQIQTAYRRAVAAAHPDHGGPGGDLAALGRARDQALAIAATRSVQSPPAAPAAPCRDPQTDYHAQATRAAATGARRAATGSAEEHIVVPTRCADPRIPAS